MGPEPLGPPERGENAVPRVCPFSRNRFFFTFFLLTTVSHSIFDADSESVVRFEIGLREVPKTTTRSAISPSYGPAGIFFIFFPKSPLKTESRDVVREYLGEKVAAKKIAVI